MVFFGIDVQDRHRDLFQIDLFPTERELPIYQFVRLVEILDELAEGFPSLVGAIEDPLLHAQEIDQLGLIVQDVGQTQVLLHV